MGSEVLEREFQYYLENQAELVIKYEGKYIVLKDQKVIGVYDSMVVAYAESIREHEVGTFLIRHVLPGTESYTQVFHTHVMA